MNRISQRFFGSVVSITVAGSLVGCATTARSNLILEDARTAYQQVIQDKTVTASAPIELRKAQDALAKAESSLASGDDTSTVDFYAGLARQRIEIAELAGKAKQAEQAVADAASQRDQILIDARTREADNQRAIAERARRQAQIQRDQAEAASRLAEQRLEHAQSAQAQTRAANIRANTAEEQLAALQAKPTARGMVLTLGDVLFNTGRAEINPGATRTLDQLARFLKENAGRSVDIEGFTDSVGSEHMNQVLSERRANRVKNALVERGVETNRISARGRGEDSPVANNQTAAGRQQNRRVEIIISN